jgi:FKBP-type peptidyl-prolyl cis-trans isomerase
VVTQSQQYDRDARGGAVRSRLALIALACALGLAALMGTACTKAAPSASESVPSTEAQSTAPSESTTPTEAATQPAAVTPAPPEAKLEIKDTKVGKGTAVKTGDTVTVHYTGWLMDGKKFDSSLDSGQPFSFTVGAGRVIEGWDTGLVGMKVGGTRVLVIPSQMGYGAQGSPPVIPADATLKFEIKLLSIQPGQ